jgi:hypothetical protein
MAPRVESVAIFFGLPRPFGHCVNSNDPALSSSFIRRILLVWLPPRMLRISRMPSCFLEQSSSSCISELNIYGAHPLFVPKMGTKYIKVSYGRLLNNSPVPH